jgi:flagellin-like protein
LANPSNILTNPKGGIEEKMKTLRKIRKNVKALSPVVASIILIAVTVAVSIAVAAWMGALTVGFMGSSSMTVTNVSFDNVSPKTITLSLKNTGTKGVTISQVKINNAAATVSTTAGNMTTSAAGDSGTLVLTGTYANWIVGNPYKIDLIDSSGQAVGSYQATAPN